MGRRGTILCALMFLLVGCGGGGGGGDDPLALLEGTWFGPSSTTSTKIVIDGSGAITRLEHNGVDTGLTGTFQHVSGPYYEGQLSNADSVRLFLDPTASYAAYFGVFILASLQKGATSLPPGGFQVSDIAPDDYVGTNFTIDTDIRITGRFASATTIAADGSYSGSDASGLTYGSPPATALAPGPDYLVGPFGDSAHATIGFIDVLPSPDARFLVVGAFPQANTFMSNASFLGAWSRP